MKRKQKSRMLTAAIACACIAIGLTGGALAYLSYTDGKRNIFTVGQVQIKASEPGYPATDSDGDGVPDDNTQMTPYKEAAKDPQITNTGKNDAIVFLKITTPVENISLIGEDGSKEDAAEDDLFWLKQAEDDENTHANHFDEEWVELTSIDNKIVTGVNTNNEGKGKTYIFAYKTRLAPGDTTTALFDKVQNKRYGTARIAADEVEKILVDSYAIQADDILKDGKVIDTTGTLDEETLTYIYNVCLNQYK